MKTLVKMLFAIIVKPIEEAINRNTAAVERLPESIGREVAKWMIKADLAKTCRALQEQVLSEMGFQPVEIVDLLYPNVGKKDRRTKAQAVSKRTKK